MLQPETRTAVLGIGQILCGDDAAGVLVARRLRRLLGSANAGWVIDAGSSPENCTGMLRRLHPDRVILVDAADMQDQPGSVRLLDWQVLDELSASTHTLPFSLMCRYLNHETDCAITVIGIQAGETEFGQRPSPAIKMAARQVAYDLAALLGHPEMNINP